MTSRKLVEDKLKLQNAIYWHHHGEEFMGSKYCVQVDSWVASDWDCGACQRCGTSKR